ncbi:FxSxx-COOH system tetratricopeptide repeat protein [Actinokineospora cianjurensis]|uniref:Tetratricopeptide repeat protein n=1 Tax=Actinokineospora cianjurensis TaxID=585224 RepID=A0A421BBP8_9PSEU|nr:FxSxx-COOH system tetratricopeptide repeat protein [Actinokineospora cianjurensis]RLK61792.1 tetratricopeptide repeat protein [Actinokineospora cianjurensis]
MSVPTTGGQAVVTVFVSVVDNAGRVDAVANLCGVLAGAGRRVLVLDWSDELTSVRDYLRVFHTGRQACPDKVWAAAQAVGGAGGGRVRDQRELAAHVVPSLPGSVDVLSLDGGLPSLRHTTVDEHALADLRKTLTTADYDDVLVALPSGGHSATLRAASVLGDTVVVCFEPLVPTLGAAVDTVDAVRRSAPLRVDIVVAATRFRVDDAEHRVNGLRTAIRQAFGPVLPPRSRLTDPYVELPELSYVTATPLLAVVAEEADDLWSRYVRLATMVDADRGVAPRRVSELVRGRYRRVAGIDVGDEQRVVVTAEPALRPWVDWVAAELAEVNVSVCEAGAGDLPVVRIAALGSADPGGADVLLHPVSVPGGRISEAMLRSVRDRVDVLRERLFSGLGYPTPPLPPDVPPKVPGLPSAVFGLPASSVRFGHRDAELDRLRAALPASDGVTTVALTGAHGVGKSELALAYAHRNAFAYDVVWWLPAHEPQATLVQLAELASRLRAEPEHYGSMAALDRFASDTNLRFLLVYDGVPEVSAIVDLLPKSGRGHVIITVASVAEGDEVDAEVPVTGLSTEQGAALVRRGATGLPPEMAAQVAAELDHWPLALNLAACWLSEQVTVLTDGTRSSYLDVYEAAEVAGTDLLSRLRADTTGPTAIHRMARLTLATARDHDTPGLAPIDRHLGAVAALVAEFGAFLSPLGAALDLVRSLPWRAELGLGIGPAADELLVFPPLIDRALWLGERYGLFEVDWGRERVRVGDVLRSTIAELIDPATRLARRTAVLRALAGYAPFEVTAGHRARFVELGTHIGPSGATGSDDPAVRRWLVNQARFFFAFGGVGVRRAALASGQEVFESWTERFGEQDELRLRMGTQLANLRRELGDRDGALALDEAVLRVQKRVHGVADPRTLATARDRGGNLRGLGRFADALVQDTVTRQHHAAVLGPDHPETQWATNNLAVSEFLAGDAGSALRTQRAHLERLARLYGDDHRDTVWALGKAGIYASQLGLPEAEAYLEEASRQARHTHWGDLQLRGSMEWHLGIAKRGRDPRSARADITNALRHLTSVRRDTHPDRFACMLSLAATQRVYGWEPAETERLARSALTGLVDTIGLTASHPFVALGKLGLGLALDARGAADAGLVEISAAQSTLESTLGRAHPWTLAATITLAAATAATGNRPEALTIATTAHAACEEYLPLDHPFTTTATTNTQVADGAPGPWQVIDVDIPQI